MSQILLWAVVTVLALSCVMAWWSYRAQREARHVLMLRRDVRSLAIDLAFNLHLCHDCVLAEAAGVADKPSEDFNTLGSCVRQDVIRLRELLAGVQDAGAPLAELDRRVEARLAWLEGIRQLGDARGLGDLVRRMFRQEQLQPVGEAVAELLAIEYLNRPYLKMLDRSRSLMTVGVVAAFVLGAVLAVTVSVRFRQRMTRLKASEGMLRNRQELVEELMRSMEEVVWIWNLDDGRLLFISPSVEKLTGYAAERFYADQRLWEKIVGSDDAARSREQVEMLRRNRRAAMSMEYSLVRADGAVREVLDRRYLILDVHGRPAQIGGIVADITDSRTVQDRLRRTTQHLEAILQYSPSAIFVVGPDGRYQLANPAFCETFDAEPDTVVGAHFSEVLPAESITHHGRRLEDLLRRPRREVFEDRFVIDGVERIVCSHTFPLLGPDGNLAALGCIGHDVTETRRADQTRRLREKQLQQADKMISLGVLVSGVAHEINNPNHLIHSHVMPLMQVWQQAQPIFDRYHRERGDFTIAGMDYAQLKERVPEMLLGIREGARRIKTIVDELRDYARDSGDRPMQPVDLNEVVASAVHLVGHAIKCHTRRFKVDYAENLPAVRGNYQRLEQVIINLIQNACQSLPDSARAVTVRTVELPEERAVAVEVADEGVGMTPEVIEHATDPFYTTRRDSGGTGLGLSVSEGIVSEHGGTLVFESTDRGTTVRVVLPQRGQGL